jgi:hypothetical protein
MSRIRSGISHDRDAIIELHQTVEKFGYSLDLLKDVFCTIETPKIIEQIEATLNLPALETELLDVGQIKVMQLASGITPVIPNERRLLEAKH